MGKVYGPWSVGYALVGIENFLIDTMLDPDKIKRYLDVILPGCLESARLQFEAGADAVMWCDHTTGDLCRAETYRDFLLEMHQRISVEMGGPSVFHCCGKTIDRVDYFAEAGWDVFHFESQVDAKEARAVAGDRISLFGNLNNPTLLYQGTAEDVYKACWDLLDAGVDGLAPEGSVPLITKKDRLMAINQATVDWSERPPAQRPDHRAPAAGARDAQPQEHRHLRLLRRAEPPPLHRERQRRWPTFRH